MNSGRLLLAESTVAECGSLGGAVANAYGQLTVVRSAIVNTPEDTGVLVVGGRARIMESTISGNGLGIEVVVEGSEVSVANSTISGNEQGGIAGLPGTIVVNSTLVGTVAVPERGAFVASGAVTMRGTLVRGSCQRTAVSGGNNVEVARDSCGFDQDTDQVEVAIGDAQLGDLADNGGPTQTHALGEGSVAIDRIPVEDCVGRGW